MIIPATRTSTVITAALVAIACLVVLEFILAGLEHFFRLLSNSVWHIAIISVLAGIARLPFPRGGFVLSAICGVLVAVAGFLIALGVAMSGI